MEKITAKPDQKTSEQRAQASIDLLRTFHFPLWALVLTLFFCLLPFVNFLGADVGSLSQPFGVKELTEWQLSKSSPQLFDYMYTHLRGGGYHSLLEWSAVMLAILCSAIALLHYSIDKDITGLLIGLALLSSGVTDAFHTLTGIRLIDAASQSELLIPFSWTLSRGFTALALLISAITLYADRRSYQLTLKHAICIGAIMLITAYGLGMYMAVSDTPQRPTLQNTVYRQIFNTFPLPVFLISGFFFWKLYLRRPGYFTVMLLLSLMPCAMAELYLMAGSKALFDHYFNSAHGLKIFAYTLPFIGYMLDLRAIIVSQQKQQKQLVELNNSLQESEHRLSTINKLLPVGLIVVNSEGQIVNANQYALELFEYREAELVGANVDKLVPGAVRGRHQSLRESYNKNPKQRRMASQIEFLKGVTRNNREIVLEIGLAPINLGGRSHTLACVLNINERKMLLDNLNEKNQAMNRAIVKLTQSNEQLERFAFVCSHDLQEPVRMVQSFSELLERRLKDNLTEKEREYLYFITDGAKRARDMINDILLFCRLDQPMGSRKLVNLSETCRQVHHTLQADIQEKQGRFTWSENLPILHAVPSQLFQLILNLVHNGLKFNRSEMPEVFLTACRQEGISNQNRPYQSELWRIKITDNGIGINEKYQQKIFQIFERLNTKSEFPGTGIGLAICRKIAEQHEAELTLRSEENKGTTFILMWPGQTAVEVPVAAAN